MPLIPFLSLCIQHGLSKALRSSTPAPGRPSASAHPPSATLPGAACRLGHVHTGAAALTQVMEAAPGLLLGFTGPPLTRQSAHPSVHSCICPSICPAITFIHPRTIHHPPPVCCTHWPSVCLHPSTRPSGQYWVRAVPCQEHTHVNEAHSLRPALASLAPPTPVLVALPSGTCEAPPMQAELAPAAISSVSRQADPASRGHWGGLSGQSL